LRYKQGENLETGFIPSSKAVLSKKISRVAHPIGAAERRQILAPGKARGLKLPAA